MASTEKRESGSSAVYAVVMAGGSGTRFWPASRETRPKQLLPLAGGDEALLAATVRRLAPLVPPERVYIATGARLQAGTRAILPDVPAANVLAEPVPRNTAPCIGWAASILAAKDPEARILVLPSDHHIENEEAFLDVLRKALDAVEAGNLVTVGIVPTRPETGYGYIELGEPLGHDVRKVARFVEKPDLARAKGYVEGKKHLWNAGMFIFRAGDMLAAIDRAMPELGEGIRAIQAGGDEALAKIFPTLPSISIDHGVMEKTANLAVVPGDFGWNDVGSWESAWELAAKDEAGNALPSAAGQISVAVDSRGNLVQTSDAKKTIALLGVEGLVVVDTGDALLVMPRDRAQDVRAIVDALKKKGGPV